MLPLKYDETAPQTSPAARPPDANGWHNHAVTVTFQGTDGTSGVATCTQTTYSGPDDPSVALSGTCVDQAGNQSPSALFTTKYDETPPQATATASRPADVNGWHNHPLTVSYAGSDATSGLASCDPTESYAGPDSASATISGACRDLAGNVAPRSVVVKYDATAPQVTIDSRPRRQRGRLVQRAARGHLRRHGSHVGSRLVRPAADLLGTRQRHSRGLRELQRPGRERPQRVLRAQVRRHGASRRVRTRLVPPARPAGTSPQFRSASLRRMQRPASPTATLPRPTRGRTPRRRPSAARVATTPGTATRAPSRSSTTRLLRRSRLRQAARRTAQAGTAPRSPSASPAATRRPGSIHAIPRRASPARIALRPRLRVRAATRPGTQAARRLRSSTTRRPRSRRRRPPASRTRTGGSTRPSQ